MLPALGCSLGADTERGEAERESVVGCCSKEAGVCFYSLPTGGWPWGMVRCLDEEADGRRVVRVASRRSWMTGEAELWGGHDEVAGEVSPLSTSIVSMLWRRRVAGRASHYLDDGNFAAVDKIDGSGV